MSLFGSLLDNMAQNALGGSLLGDALPNTQAQPQGGLLGAPAPAAQPQQFQPSPQQQQQMRSQFLMHIGAALQQGQPIANGVQNYQQGMVAQIQAAKQAQMAQQQQRIMGTFSQEMQAAGTDPKAQQAVIAKYAPYVPPATLKDMVSMTRIETPKPVGIKQTIEGIDPKTGQPATFALMDDTTVRQLQGIAPEKHLAADGDGNIYNTKTGATEIPGTQKQVMAALIAKNKGDVAAAYDEYKSAGKQVKDASPTQASLALQAAGGDPAKALQLMKQKPAQVNVQVPGNAPQGNWAQPLPGALEAYAQAIKDNRMTGQDLSTAFPSRGKEGQQARAAVMARATYLNGGTAPDFAGANATRKNQTSNQNMQVQQAIQNLDQNMGIATDAYNKLGFTSSPLANKAIAIAENAKGDPNIARYSAARNNAVQELAIVLGKGAVTDASRREADSSLPMYSSPQQWQAVISNAKQESGNRQNSLTSPFKYGTGTPGIQQPTAQAPGVPQIGQTFNGGKVLKVTRIK